MILFLLGVFIVRHEACTCPSHWAFLSLFGVIAIACGPRVYRLLGMVIVLAAVFFTYQARQTQMEISKRWDLRLLPKLPPAIPAPVPVSPSPVPTVAP
jgi:hypothetical protein